MNEYDDMKKTEPALCSGCGASFDRGAEINEDDFTYCTSCREHFLVSVPESDSSLCDTCGVPMDRQISRYDNDLRLCTGCLDALNHQDPVPSVDLPIIIDPDGVPCLQCGDILQQHPNRNYRFQCDNCGSVVRSLVAYWNTSDRELSNFRLGGIVLYLLPGVILLAIAAALVIMGSYMVALAIIPLVSGIMLIVSGIMWRRRSLRGGGEIYILSDGVRTAAGDMLWSDDWHLRGAVAQLWDAECRGGMLPAIVLMYRGGRHRRAGYSYSG